MKKLVWFISFLLLSQTIVFSARFSDQQEEIRIKSDWLPGKIFNYSLTKIYSDFSAPPQSKNDTIFSHFSIRVISTATKQKQMEVTIHNTKTTFSEIVPDKLSKITDNLTVKFRTDQNGASPVPENVKILRDSIISRVKNTAKLMEGRPGMDEMLNMTIETYNSDSAIEKMTLREVKMLHQLFGKEFHKKKSTIVNTKETIIFSDDSVKAEIIYKVNPVDSGNNKIQIESEKKMNQDELKMIVKAYMNKIMNAKNIPADKNFRLPEYEFYEHQQILYDTDANIITDLKYESGVSLGGRGKKETVILKLK